MKINWWQYLPIWPWRVLGFVEHADEIPERLPRRAAVIVGTPAFSKWFAFDCACGHKHRIMVNADPARHPSWQMTQLRPLSISPSIDYKGERHCHYFIRNGKTLWARGRD